MSRVSDEWIQEQERGWVDPRTSVCRSCIGDDDFLRRLIRENWTSNPCTYCRSPRRRAAPLLALMPAIYAAIRYSYSDEANAGAPMSGDFDLDYVSSIEVVNDVVDTEGLEWSEELTADVANALSDEGWVHAPDGQWMGEYEHERLAYSWRSFALAVKHKSRFHFSAPPPERDYDQEVSAHQMLPFLASVVRKHKMMRRLAKGTTWYRVRRGIYPCSVEALGPPPLDKVTAGRMNPAGIPYFYLATVENTAIAEARLKPKEPATLGQWVLARDVHVLDLTKLPRSPSVFAGDTHRYDMVHFIYEFVGEISQAVRPDQSEHIEYVPTQVICEFFAQSFTYGRKKRLDGIIYPSAVAPGGQNLVLFPKWRYGYEPDWGQVASLTDSLQFTGASA